MSLGFIQYVNGLPYYIFLVTINLAYSLATMYKPDITVGKW